MHASLALAERSAYIIHMDKSVMPRALDWYSSILDSIKSASLVSTATLQNEARLLYSYKKALNGFSALLSSNDLESLKAWISFSLS